MTWRRRCIFVLIGGRPSAYIEAKSALTGSTEPAYSQYRHVGSVTARVAPTKGGCRHTRILRRVRRRPWRTGGITDRTRFDAAPRPARPRAAPSGGARRCNPFDWAE